MLPIVDTPTIHYVVEEAVAAGITDILMIIGKGKRSLEEYFDRNFELEQELAAKNKQAELETLNRIAKLANIHFIWQKELNGLGDAISYARYHVGQEPFAVLLGDTLVESPEPVTKQLCRVFERYGESVVALEQVERSKVGRYGVMGGRKISDELWLIDELVEKPDPEQAPSNLVFAGRYVFTPEIFDCIDQTVPGKNNEIQLTDAMRMLVEQRAMYGLHFEGRRWDIGNKLDFLKTNIAYGLKRKDIGDKLREYILEIAHELEHPAASGTV
jgi:UTP--glucose-1-phosphate uridylyltransferase